MRILSKSDDVNLLRLLVDKAEITPYAQIRGGVIESGVIVKISQYNLNDILVQILEDYGEEEVIKRIKEL